MCGRCVSAGLTQDKRAAADICQPDSKHKQYDDRTPIERRLDASWRSQWLKVCFEVNGRPGFSVRRHGAQSAFTHCMAVFQSVSCEWLLRPCHVFAAFTHNLWCLYYVSTECSHWFLSVVAPYICWTVSDTKLWVHSVHGPSSSNWRHSFKLYCSYDQDKTTLFEWRHFENKLANLIQ